MSSEEQAQDNYYAIDSIGETSYAVYLFNDIQEPHHYVGLCAFLRSISSKCDVRIHINCRGGNLATTLSILYAMQECQALITTVAEGMVASGATLIFLNADEYQVMPFTQFLFHPASSGEMGKLSDMQSSLNSTQDLVAAVYGQLYDGFLTEEEIEQVTQYREYYMDSEEVVSRLESMREKTEQAQLSLDLEG